MAASEMYLSVAQKTKEIHLRMEAKQKSDITKVIADVDLPQGWPAPGLRYDPLGDFTQSSSTITVCKRRLRKGRPCLRKRRLRNHQTPYVRPAYVRDLPTLTCTYLRKHRDPYVSASLTYK